MEEMKEQKEKGKEKKGKKCVGGWGPEENLLFVS